MTKNIFRGKNVLRFKLVQKSVRDLKENSTEGDEERIFEPMNRAAAKCNLFAEQPVALPPATDTTLGIQHEPGEAQKYGVLYDDRNYDYTRHLKKIGECQDAVFVSAKPISPPASSSPSLELMKMSDDSEKDTKIVNAADPAIIEALEALEDDAYVDQELADDFVVQLDRHKEEDTAVLCPVFPSLQVKTTSKKTEKIVWKKQSTLDQASLDLEHCTLEELDDYYSEFSSIDEDEDDDDEYQFINDDDDDDDHSMEEINEEELHDALDEFLLYQNDYLRPTAAERKAGAVALLDALRKEMGPISSTILERFRYQECEAITSDDGHNDSEDTFDEESSESDHLDCQSIITTFTTTENLPAVIREKKKKSISQEPIEPIRISRRGMAILDPIGSVDTKEPAEPESTGVNRGMARNKSETVDEKRARKSILKEERRQNRAAKKELRVRFRQEVGFQ